MAAIGSTLVVAVAGNDWSMPLVWPFLGDYHASIAPTISTVGVLVAGVVHLVIAGGLLFAHSSMAGRMAAVTRISATLLGGYGALELNTLDHPLSFTLTLIVAGAILIDAARMFAQRRENRKHTMATTH